MSEKPAHSTRFTRAARAESERLLRRQHRAAEQVQKLEEQLGAARSELGEISERLETLRSFTNERPELKSAPAADADIQVLGGAEIRHVAIQLLQGPRWNGGPIHYRRWLELLEESGYRVDGKRPDAVFLGQVSRSPVVRATTSAGFYELDEQAPQRIADEIASLEREISETGIDTSADPERIERRMERQQALSTELRRAQRALKEALAVLGRSDSRVAA
jgi:septal ring factor EnvC (AmiA/AmiB activator)